MIPPDSAATATARLPLLVLASVPPPVHGQNVMVAAMLEVLKQDRDIEIIHIDPRLSSTTGDVGRWQPGKLWRLLRACMRVWAARARRGPFALYYVPAPPRRVPVVRDWIALALCRPVARKLVLHWHAVGLGAWVQQEAKGWERWLTRRALDSADLAIVLAPELAADAETFRPRKIAMVPNGIRDPRATGTPEFAPRDEDRNRPLRVLSLGLGNESKGVFRTAAAVIAANRDAPHAFEFVFAGNFETPEDEARFKRLSDEHPQAIRHAGFADAARKAELFAWADVCSFPTTYPYEGQPLVLLEALAYDLPLITTRWRGIPSLLPTDANVWLVEPEDSSSLRRALEAARHRAARTGRLRHHFLTHFTRERHGDVLKMALRDVL